MACLQHWLDAVEGVFPAQSDAGPWKVTVRWVYDSEKFNEWMNPLDYETEEAVAEQERLGLVIEPATGAAPTLAITDIPIRMEDMSFFPQAVFRCKECTLLLLETIH